MESKSNHTRAPLPPSTHQVEALSEHDADDHPHEGREAAAWHHIGGGPLRWGDGVLWHRFRSGARWCALLQSRPNVRRTLCV